MIHRNNDTDDAEKDDIVGGSVMMVVGPWRVTSWFNPVREGVVALCGKIEGIQSRASGSCRTV